MPSAPSPLVTTDWLANELETGTDSLILLDASWHMPDSKRDARAEFDATHIPGALFFDIDALSMQAFPLPHMMLRADLFEDAMSEMGVSSRATIVVYDNSDVKTAARVWWNFLVMGHTRVFVLDGGLPKWLREKRPTSNKSTKRKPARFKANLQPDLLRCQDDVLMNLHQPREQVVDARSPARFEGAAPEPRKGLRSGHIPGAVNLPYNTLYAEDGTMLSKEELITLFSKAGIDLARPIITSCGSGITACVVKLGLAVIGKLDVAIYDGSWTEWGGLEDLPIETGPAGDV